MKDEYISLIPTRGPDNAIQWTMIHDGHVGQGTNYPDVDLPPDGKPSKIQFTIVDLNNTQITFDPTLVDNNSKPKALNAIWIADGSGGQKKAGLYPEQISQVRLQSNNTQLVVGDKNSEEVVLTYQLNFKGPAGSTESIPAIDPEIRNGGGGGFYLNMDTVAAVLGLAVLALTALLWFTHFRSAKTKAQGPGG